MNKEKPMQLCTPPVRRRTLLLLNKHLKRKPAVVEEPKPETKPEPVPEVKPEPVTEPKPEIKAKPLYREPIVRLTPKMNRAYHMRMSCLNSVNS